MERDGKDIPLVTDLDGTLVAGDTLVEGVKDLLARRPWMCCVLPFWVARGRRFFKKQLAPWSAAACLRMPLNASVADLLGEAARTGAGSAWLQPPMRKWPRPCAFDCRFLTLFSPPRRR